MGLMTAETDGMADTATLVIGQRVRLGFNDEYAQWHDRVSAAAKQCQGHLETIVREPDRAENQWVTVVKFDSVINMRSWLNSPTRQEFLDEGRHLFDGPATQQIIAGRHHENGDSLATVVVNFRVAPERSEAFLAFQHQLAASSGRYPGFRGAEVFRPIEGVQDHWTVLFRFDNVEHLDQWLVSEDRRRLLRGSEFGEFQMKRIDHAFGSWFSESEGSQRPPSPLRTTLAIWLGLYPTVVLLSSALRSRRFICRFGKACSSAIYCLRPR